MPSKVGDASYEPLFPYDFGIFFRPSLSIDRTAHGVTLSWPAASGGFALEYSETMEDGDWTRFPDTSLLINDAHVLEVPTAGTRRGVLSARATLNLFSRKWGSDGEKEKEEGCPKWA